MNNILFFEKSLRRYIKKSKNISYSIAVLISFLITGGLSYSVEQDNSLSINNEIKSRKDINSDISKIYKKIKERRIETKQFLEEMNFNFFQLLNRWDFYQKKNDRSYQIFFNYTKDYTHNKNKTLENFARKDYDNINFLKDENGNVTKYDGIYNKRYNYSNTNWGSYGIFVNKIDFTDKIELGANIIPKKVEKKEISFNLSKEIKDIDIKEITISKVEAPEEKLLNLSTVTPINILTPSGISNIEPLEVKDVENININIKKPNIVLNEKTNNVIPPVVPSISPIEPTAIVPPSLPNEPQELSVNIFAPPSLSFIGTGFWQDDPVGFNQNNGNTITRNTGNFGRINDNVVIENYENYKTTDEHTRENPFDIVTGTGTYNGEYIGSGTKWTGTLRAWSNKEFNYDDTMTSGSFSSARNAFINELRDHDAIIDGNFRMRYLGGDLNQWGGNSYTKLFLSYNPAGRTPAWSGLSKQRTVELKGYLELHGSPNVNKNGNWYEILAGVEHQLWNSQDNKEGASNFLNSGEINLASGNNVIGIMIDIEQSNSNGENKRVNDTTINNGLISINNKNSIGIDFANYVNFNYIPLDVSLGNIVVNGSNNYGFRMKNILSNTYYDDVTIDSGGDDKKIVVSGEKNVGLAIGKSLSLNPNPHVEVGNKNYDLINDRKDSNPIKNFFNINIEVKGKETVGFLRLKDQSTNNTNDYVFNDKTMGKFTFGAGAKDSTLIRTDKYGITVEKDINISDSEDLTKESTGNTVLHSNASTSVSGSAKPVEHIINKGNISVGAGFNKTIGILATAENKESTTVNESIVNYGKITIKGKNSIGLYVDSNVAGGKNFGDIDMQGESSIGIFNNRNFTIENKNSDRELTISAQGKNSSVIYNKGNLEFFGANKINISGNNGATAIFSNGVGSKIENKIGDKLSINVSGVGSTDKGVAVYSKNGSLVELKNSNIKVEDGSAGIVVEGANSKVDLTSAKVEYSGNGLAIYTDADGVVDLSKATVTLKGKAVGFDMDLKSTVSNVVFDTDSRVKVESDNVTVFNLKNINNLTTIGGIEGTIISSISTKLGYTADALKDLLRESTATRYKIANVDGANLTVGNIDKTGTSTDTESAKRDGYQFYNNFLGQRMNVTATGSKISAILNNEQANIFGNKVIAFESNSSKNAISVNENQFNLVNSQLLSDRIEAGSGAIGIFSNYGLVNVDKNSSVKVEKENNAINSDAVGIYAVNGSKVDNKGTIEVGGDSSVGIIGMAYRLNTENNLVENEFGSQTDQGKINIVNSGSISLDGKASIGILANNNKINSVSSDSIVDNQGLIEVGDSSADKTAIAIYSKTSEVKNIDTLAKGLKVGKDSIGIYASENSKIEETGRINLLSDRGIGIYLKDASTIASSKILTLESNENKIGNIGIYYNTDSAVVADTKIDMTNAKNITAYYSKDKNINLNVDTNVSEKSVALSGGIDADLIFNNGKIINLDKEAIGISGIAGNKIKNEGIININGERAIAIVSKNSITNMKEIANEGTVNLNSSNGVAVYLDKSKFFNLENINFNANAKDSIGIFGNNDSDITLSNPITLNYSHESKNIYAYLDNSTLKINNSFSLAPTGIATTADRAIGIYSNKNNTIEVGNKIEVSNKGIAIYSKEDGNTITLGATAEIVSKNDETIGIYSEGKMTIAKSGIGSKKIIADNKATGVYIANETLTLDNVELDVSLGNEAVAFYIAKDGKANATGTSKIILDNISPNKNVIGMYFAGDDTNLENEKENNFVIETKNTAQNIIAQYIGKKANIKNMTDIIIKSKESVGAFVAGGSKYTNIGNISSITGVESVKAIHTIDGEAVNDGTISLENTEVKVSTAMSAIPSANKTAILKNSSNIEVKGNSIGVLGIANGNKKVQVENIGKIIAKNDGANKASAVYLKGDNVSFDSSSNSSSIETQNIGLYLENTIAGKVKNINSLKLNEDNAIGVYAKNSVVDFKFVPEVATGKKAISLYSEGTTKVSTDIVAGDEGQIAVYAKDNQIVFDNKKITAGRGSVGLYTDKWASGNIEKVTINSSENGVALFIASDTKNKSDISLSATINQNGENGIGVYIPKNSKLTTKEATINVNGGTAFYVEGELKTGTNANEKMIVNFGENGGNAIYVDGGLLNIGSEITTTGSGNILTTKNGSINISADLNLKANKNSIAVKGIYDSTMETVAKAITNDINGKISLNGDKSIGIFADVRANTTISSVTIENKGTIEVGDAKSSIGIFSKGANVNNRSSIGVGENGIGIYYTNENSKTGTSLSSTDIKLLKEGGTGIFINKGDISGDIVAGNIISTKLNTKGIFANDGKALTIKDFNINLGDNSKNLLFLNNKFTLDVNTNEHNIVKVGATTDKNNKAIGIVAQNSDGEIKNTNVEIGDASIGIYVNGIGKTVKYDLVNSSKISTVGKDSILAYVENGELALNSGGSLQTGKGIGAYLKKGVLSADSPVDIEVNDKNGIGIVANSGTINNNIKVKVNAEEGVGAFLKGNEITNLSVVKVAGIKGNRATGYILENVTANISIPHFSLDNASEEQVGLFTKGNGRLVTLSGFNVLGKKNIGVFNQGKYKIKNNGNIQIADVNSEVERLIGIFSNGGTIESNGNISIGKNSVGIYAENYDISSVGNIQVKDKGLGLFSKGKESQLVNISTNGNLETANNSIGIYTENSNLTSNGNINIGDENSIGVYSIGNGNLDIKSNSISVGKDSIGIYKESKGDISVKSVSGSGKFDIAEKGYGIYAIGGNKIDISNVNMKLGKEAVGIYTKDGSLNYNGDITVGETTIGADGYTDPNVNKNSIGIYSDNSNVSYNGNMSIDKPLSVGIYSKAKKSDIVIENGATITAKNGGIGILAKNIKTIVNKGYITADGKAKNYDPSAPDDDKTISIGIAAYSGEIINEGTIEAKNGGLGVYTGGTSIFRNNGGQFIVDAQSQSVKNGASVDLPDDFPIKISKTGVVTIGEKVINGGYLSIRNGDLNMDNMAIDISTGKTVIDARTIKGKAFVTPEFSQGTNLKKITVKNVFATKPNGLDGFSGEVKSRSLSWIAKITDGVDASGNNVKDITMAKLPYISLVEPKRYVNLALGMEELYSRNNKEAIQVFDLFDKIEKEEEFSDAVVELRGDIYSNVQERMKYIDRVYDKSYEELFDSYNKTKNVEKFSVIRYDSLHNDDTMGVANYKVDSMGLLYLNDREGITYGGKYGWSLGITENKFKFSGKVNDNSKERVFAIKAGLHYQTPLNDSKNAEFKYLGRLELTSNFHRTRRNINIQGSTFNTNAKYQTYDFAFKNRLFYDYDISEYSKLKPYIELDLSYGKVRNIKENGSILRLDIKAKDYLLATTRAGLEYRKYFKIKEDHRLKFVTKAEIGYDLNKLYKTTNRAKLADTSTDYYDLSRPEKRRFEGTISVELGYEKANNYGINFGIDYKGQKEDSFRKDNLNYTARLNYKF